MKPLFASAVAGFVATVPMTIAMQILHRFPAPERDSLPPEQITEVIVEKAADQVGAQETLDRPQLQALTLVTHFGFGAAAGGLYGLISPHVKTHPALKGAAWGMTVWTLSYLGWLPATHILAPATQTAARRNFLMIFAHLVWGVSTALLTEKLAAEEDSGLF